MGRRLRYAPTHSRDTKHTVPTTILYWNFVAIVFSSLLMDQLRFTASGFELESNYDSTTRRIVEKDKTITKLLSYNDNNSIPFFHTIDIRTVDYKMLPPPTSAGRYSQLIKLNDFKNFASSSTLEVERHKDLATRAKRSNRNNKSITATNLIRYNKNDLSMNQRRAKSSSIMGSSAALMRRKLGTFQRDQRLQTSIDGSSISDMNNYHNDGISLTSSLCLGIEDIFIALFLVLLILTTILGNVLVVLSVFMYKRMRTFNNFLLTSLATADLLVGLLIMPLSLIDLLHNHNWPFSRLLCRIWATTDVLLCTASILNLCIISLDRYMAITSPLKYPRTRSRLMACGLLCFVWGVAMIVCSPPWFIPEWGLFFNQSVRQQQQKQQQQNGPSTTVGGVEASSGGFACAYSPSIPYRIYSALFSFYIPLMIMLSVYFKIFRVASERERIMRQNLGTCRLSRRVEKTQRKYKLYNNNTIAINNSNNNRTSSNDRLLLSNSNYHIRCASEPMSRIRNIHSAQQLQHSCLMSSTLAENNRTITPAASRHACAIQSNHFASFENCVSPPVYLSNSVFSIIPTQQQCFAMPSKNSAKNLASRLAANSAYLSARLPMSIATSQPINDDSSVANENNAILTRPLSSYRRSPSDRQQQQQYNKYGQVQIEAHHQRSNIQMLQSPTSARIGGITSLSRHNRLRKSHSSSAGFNIVTFRQIMEETPKNTINTSAKNTIKCSNEKSNDDKSTVFTNNTNNNKNDNNTHDCSCPDRSAETTSYKNNRNNQDNDYSNNKIVVNSEECCNRENNNNNNDVEKRFYCINSSTEKMEYSNCVELAPLFDVNDSMCHTTPDRAKTTKITQILENDDFQRQQQRQQEQQVQNKKNQELERQQKKQNLQLDLLAQNSGENCANNLFESRASSPIFFSASSFSSSTSISVSTSPLSRFSSQKVFGDSVDDQRRNDCKPMGRSDRFEKSQQISDLNCTKPKQQENVRATPLQNNKKSLSTTTNYCQYQQQQKEQQEPSKNTKQQSSRYKNYQQQHLQKSLWMSGNRLQPVNLLAKAQQHYQINGPGKNIRGSKEKIVYLRERKALKTIGIVVLGFIICWMPFFVVYLVEVFIANTISASYTFKLINEFFLWLGYSNSVLNPIIYTMYNGDFRRCFRDLLGFGCIQHHRRTMSVKKLHQQSTVF